MLKGSILQKLFQAHENSSKPINLGVYYKNTLVALCHALEDFILETENQPLMVTAFQRGKWYLQEAERYGDLADKAQKIAIMAAGDAGFAEHPTSSRENVALVKLNQDDPVAQEWHLMIIAPSYTAMVLCQELSEAEYGAAGQPQEDLERKFYGFWTFEPDLVTETVQLAIDHIKTYDRELARDLSVRKEQIASQYTRQTPEKLTGVVSRVIDYLQDCKTTIRDSEKDADFNFFQDLDDNIVSNEMQAFLRMAQIIDLTDTLNPMAATEVSALGEAMGQLLDLPAWQIKRLRLSGLLHRIDLSSQTEVEKTTTTVQKEALEHQDSLPQSSVLRIMPQIKAIAIILNHQTETWDGSGLPSGLAYDDIPLESRILRLLADFQQQLIHYRQEDLPEGPLAKALANCQNYAGKIYDPKLVDALALLVMGMQQGMTLSTYRPKIATGMWLIE